MTESWRELLYPLGFLASLAFGGRFLLQWLSSEIERKSYVTKAFWQLSLAGNVMLLIHSLIQIQYHVCIIQACNAIISWRNINLMESPAKQVSFRTVLYLLLAAAVAVSSVFLIQGYVLGHYFTDWFRLPVWRDETPQEAGILWHLFGTLGLILFSSRFWVQWWYSEKAKTSYLGLQFWWLSLAGGVLTLLYFIRIDDPVNIIGPAFGLVPYIRNLMLMRKELRSNLTAGAK